MDHDAEKYHACMNEIKNRTAIVREALGPHWGSVPVAVPNVELACLQLRKMYELIAFAALSAQKPRYEKIRRRFEKDWRLPDIVRLIDKFNPGFLPVGFIDVGEDIIEQEELRITPSQLIRWHSNFGEALHAFNPYREPMDYVDTARQCERHLDHFVKIMSRHKVNVIRDEVFYLVTMQALHDGSIQVAPFYRTDGELIKKVAH